MQAFINYGQQPGPFLTVAAPVKEKPLDWQLAGLTWTATGYGMKIATRYMVKVAGRWQRIYRRQFSNAPTLFIVTKDNPFTVVNLDD